MSDIEIQEVENISIDDVFVDDIDKYIKLWMNERGITDLCKVSQNRWYNCCKFIYKNVFRVNPEYLKVNHNINNQYDKEKVLKVLEYYIDLCNDYEKIINITGFTFFTGIHRDTINDWSHDMEFSSLGSDISQKLDIMREESLVGLQVSGKGNPMNYMPSLNKYCGFNMPGVREQGNNKTQSIDQIQQRYRVETSDNTAETPQIEPPKADF